MKRANPPAPSRSLAFVDEGELHFRRFAESSDDVFWLADPASGQLLYVSPRFEELWGVSCAALLRDPTLWNRALAPDDADHLPSPFFAGASYNEETVREYRIVGSAGQCRWIRDRRFRLRDRRGRPNRVGGIAEDVTERKQREMEREELLQRERAARANAEALASSRDEFLAVVTHELRSPLNAIRGWAHVLRHSGPLNTAQLKALDAVDRNTQTQARMVDDLLDSQRILCGNLQLNFSRVALKTLIEQAVEAVQPTALAKRIRLEVRHDEAIGPVSVDVGRLSQALVNLLSNAVKFTPEDGIVQVGSEGRDNGLAIQVRDTGVGLEPEQLPFVFDRFQQGDSSNTRRQNGLGLGLSLAQQLVELHSGHITVESQGAGCGATFTIVLPGTVATDSAEPCSAESMPDTPRPLSGKHIVIVEDDDDGREILEMILRDANATLHSFDRAASAFEYLERAPPEEQPDALISDIAMPDEDGYAFIRRVRELEGGRRHLVALALTAFSRLEDRRRALRAGFDAHVAKPIDSYTVLHTLAVALGLLTKVPDGAQR